MRAPSARVALAIPRGRVPVAGRSRVSKSTSPILRSNPMALWVRNRERATAMSAWMRPSFRAATAMRVWQRPLRDDAHDLGCPGGTVALRTWER